MENPKSYDQLLVIAIGVMQANDLEEVYATEDGQVFYNDNRAELHAKAIESKVYRFDNKAKLAQTKKQEASKRAKGGKAETTEVEETPNAETTGEQPDEEDEQKTE